MSPQTLNELPPDSFLSYNRHNRRPRRRRTSREALAWIEALEVRQLLTINAVFNPIDATHGKLHIDTNAADNITISLSLDGTSTVLVNGNQVFSGGQTFPYLRATDPNFTELEILASGNFANLVALSGVTLNAFTSLLTVTVSAGAGDDTIIGSEFGDLLQGGDGNDTYQFGGAFGADTVSDSQGNDTLDLHAVGGDLVATVSSQSITDGVNSVAFSTTEIENLVSGTGHDTFQGIDAPSTWTLGATQSYASGPVNLTFSGFEVLQGGSKSDLFNLNQTQNSPLVLKGGLGNDRFELADGVHGDTLDGEGGADTLSYMAYTTAVTVDLSQPAATNVLSITGIEGAVGGNGDDSLTGDSNKNFLDGQKGNDTLTGGGGLDVLRGGLGDDRLINGVDSDGQVGNDLIVINASLDTQSITDITLVAETIQLGADLKTDGGKIVFFGNVVISTASVLIDTETGNDSVPGSVKFNNGTISAQSTLDDLTIDTSTKGSANAGPIALTTFDNAGGAASKVHDLTLWATSGQGLNASLNLGAGIDVSHNVTVTAGPITVDRPVTADGDITLTALGAASDLTINLDQFGGNLSVRSTGGNLLLEADQTVAIHEDVSTTGSGTITITGNATAGARNIVVDSAAQLQTVNGDLTLIANQGQNPLPGSFVGILVSGATVNSSGGNVMLQGHGGSNGSGNVGVQIDSNGLVSSGSSGTLLTLTGFGGGGTRDSHGDGVLVTGNSTITSSGGDVQITGYGNTKSTAGNSNRGVSALNGGTIKSGTIAPLGTAGLVTVTGYGGAGSGGFNEGVHIDGSGSLITSGGGDVLVTGLEGLSSSGLAIVLLNSGSISTAINGGHATLSGNSMNIAPSATVSTTSSGAVTLRPQATGVGIDLGAVSDPFGGPLSLSDAELDQVTAGLIQIGDGTSGQITISNTIDRSSVTNFALMASGSHDNIAFNGPNAVLDSDNGNVSLTLNPSGTGSITSGGAVKDVVANELSLESGSGGIGTAANPLSADAVSLTAATQNNASVFLSEFDSVAIGSDGLSAGLGTITLSSGMFQLSGSNKIDATSPLVIKSGATFSLNGFDQTLDSLKGDGTVIGGSGGTPTLTINGSTNGTNGLFSGTLGGAGVDNFGLAKAGAGALTLSGTNTYSGSTTITGGTLLLNGSVASDVLVQGTGTLGGTGSINSANTLSIGNGGTLAPGNSPGILNSGSVSFTGASTFAVQLNGTLVGQQYDQLNVTGTVDIGAGTLDATLGFTPAPGATFVIINNDGSDAVTGTFDGLPQDSLLTIGGQAFHIVYDFDSGDGNHNDVALIALPPSVTIVPTTDYVIEGDSGFVFAVFAVRLSQPSVNPIDVDYSTLLSTGPNAARDTDDPNDLNNPRDFYQTAGTVHFDPFSTEELIRVQIAPDRIPEPDESFLVQLTAATNATLGRDLPTATATIRDDDTVPQLIVSKPSVLEGDPTSGTPNELVYTLTVSGRFNASGHAMVHFETGAPSDTAIAGSDYQSQSGDLLFTDQTRTQEVRVPIIGDLVDEADGTVSLVLSNAQGLGLPLSPAAGTIINDDSPNAVLQIDSQTVREGTGINSPAILTVTLIGKPTGPVTVNYSTSDQTAMAGQDYLPASGTLTFTPGGPVTQTIPVTIIGDSVHESAKETFSLNLTSAVNATIDTQLGIGAVSILDDDGTVIASDGDQIAAEISTQLTDLFNAGGGVKSNPELVAALLAAAGGIAQRLGLTKALVIVIDPVDFILSDPQGRQSGFTEGTGVVNQIPGTYYSGNGPVELLIVPLPPDGVYTLQLAGLGGAFNAAIAVTINGETGTSNVSTSLDAGSNLQVSINIGPTIPNSPIVLTVPVGLGLGGQALNGNSTFGVVGANSRFARFDIAARESEESASSFELTLDESKGSPIDQLFNWIMAARATRERLVQQLFESLDLPFEKILESSAESKSPLKDQLVNIFLKRLSQTLTGMPAGAYGLGDMLDKLLHQDARSSKKTPGEQGKNNSGANSKQSPKIKRSTNTRQQAVPRSGEKPKGDTQQQRSQTAPQDSSTAQSSALEITGDQQNASALATLWNWLATSARRS